MNFVPGIYLGMFGNANEQGGQSKNKIHEFSWSLCLHHGNYPASMCEPIDHNN